MRGVAFKTLAEVTVVTAGTAVPVVVNTLYCYSISIRSVDSNTGTQYVGDSTVTAANGMPMKNGDTVEVDTPESKARDGFDASLIYVNADQNNQKFRVMACVRD